MDGRKELGFTWATLSKCRARRIHAGRQLKLHDFTTLTGVRIYENVNPNALKLQNHIRRRTLITLRFHPNVYAEDICRQTRSMLRFPRARGIGILMSDPVVESLILDLLQWISSRTERPYEEVMDAWRTSCPRLPVWEDANDRGLVRTEEVNGRCVVKATSLGLVLIEQRKDHLRLNPGAGNSCAA